SHGLPCPRARWSESRRRGYHRYPTAHSTALRFACRCPSAPSFSFPRLRAGRNALSFAAPECSAGAAKPGGRYEGTGYAYIPLLGETDPKFPRSRDQHAAEAVASAGDGSSSAFARGDRVGARRCTPLSAARDAELGLFEVDEAALPEVARRLRPRAVCLGNLFRDQLDRYGELELLAQRWRAAVSSLPETAALVVNGDDPQVGDLASGRRA